MFRTIVKCDHGVGACIDTSGVPMVKEHGIWLSIEDDDKCEHRFFIGKVISVETSVKK